MRLTVINECTSVPLPDGPAHVAVYDAGHEASATRHAALIQGAVLLGDAEDDYARLWVCDTATACRLLDAGYEALP